MEAQKQLGILLGDKVDGIHYRRRQVEAMDMADIFQQNDQPKRFGPARASRDR